MRRKKGTIPFPSTPPSINNQVCFCVTALQDIIQLHLPTDRVVGLFLTSQHFSSDRYKTAVKTRLQSTFHLMTDHHIHIHDIHRHVKSTLLFFWYSWGEGGCWNLWAGWWKPWADWPVCDHHQQTTNKASLSFCQSVVHCHFVLCLSHTQTQSDSQTHTHPGKHKQDHTHRVKLHNQLINLSLKRCFCLCITLITDWLQYLLVCKV